MKRCWLFVMLLLICAASYAQIYNTNKSKRFEVSGGYIGDFFANIDGGIKRGIGICGLANLDLSVRLWKGGSLFVKGCFTHGMSPSANYFGDWQTVINSDADGTHLYFQEMWISQKIKNVELILGLQDVNIHFMNSETAGSFINSSFGIPPIQSESCPFPIFPLTGLGITGKWQINDRNLLQLAVYDGYVYPFEKNPYNLKWNIAATDGSLIIGEYQGSVAENHNFTYKIGGFFHSGVKNESVEFHRHYGGYFITDIILPKNWSIFTQLVIGEKQKNAIEEYVGIGTTYTFREFNQIGLGVASSGFILDKKYYNETAIELFYHRKITNQIEIQPELQYIIQPSGQKGAHTLAFITRLCINL